MDLKEKQLASVEQEVVLRTLAESVACPGCKFLEVGSWLGDSTVILARVAKAHGGVLFCVDWWKGNPGTDLVDIASKADVFSIFWSRICREGLDEVVVPIRSRSDLAAQVIKENSFNLVFLDADHIYEAVLNDIKQYSHTVEREHGIFCGHDCEGRVSDYKESFLREGQDTDYYETVHCGVVLSVGEMFPNCSINHGIWSVRFSSEQNAWVPTDVKLNEIQNERQPMPPLLGYSRNCFLMRYGKSVYAISRANNLSDIKNEKDLERLNAAVADSWQELEKKINDTVVLHLELYKEYNIYKFSQVFYGLLRSIDVSVLWDGDQNVLNKHRNSHALFTAGVFHKLKDLIDQCDVPVENPTAPAIPVLVEEGYEGYNIVRLGTCYWALLQSLGLVDLSEPGINVFLERCVDQGKCFLGNSIFELKYLIIQFKNSILQSDIALREQNISALKQDVLLRNESIFKFDAAIQAYNKKIEVLQTDIVMREQNIGALKQDILHRDESVAKLDAEIQVYSKKTVDLQADIAKREHGIEVLKTELNLIKSKWWFRLFGGKC